MTVPRGAAATSQHPGPEKGGGKKGRGEERDRERKEEGAERRRPQEVTQLRRKQSAAKKPLLKCSVHGSK